MKNLITLIAAMTLAACGTQKSESQAESAHFAYAHANEFVCTSENGLYVSYITADIAGQRELNVNNSGCSQAPGALHCNSIINVLSARGQDVNVETVQSNLVVSAHRYIPDFSSTTYELLIPKADLEVGPAGSNKFKSTFTTTYAQESFMGPTGKGSEKTEKVDCTASLVLF